MRAMVQDGYGSADVLKLRDSAGPRSVRRRCSSGCVPLAWIRACGT